MARRRCGYFCKNRIMEYCRHDYIREALGFDSILLNNKIVTKAIFSGTCVKAGGGRPFLPESLLGRLAGVPEWDGEL